MLDVKIERVADGLVRVRLTGRLDTHTYALCEEHIRPLLAPATQMLVMDMGGVDYLSSMGLRVLLQANKAMSAHGGRVLLANLQAPVRKVIEIANALPKQAVFASVEEADRYFDQIQKRAKEEPGAPNSQEFD